MRTNRFLYIIFIVLLANNTVSTGPVTVTINPTQSRSNTVTAQVQQPVQPTVVTTKVQRPIEVSTPGVVRAHESTITDTGVMVKNNSDDKMSFALAAIHTTYEKTPMFSRAYNMYVTQSVVSDLVDVDPHQTISSLNVNNDGKDILERERTFAIIIIAIKRTTDEQVKKTCSDTTQKPFKLTTDRDGNPLLITEQGQYRLSTTLNDEYKFPISLVDQDTLKTFYFKQEDFFNVKSVERQPVMVCQVFDMELTVTEHVTTWISNARTKKVIFKSPPIIGQANVFEFPNDFIFDKTEDTTHTTPNYQKIIDMMKEVEKKYNRTIFPSHYFKKETLQQLPLKEVSNVSTYAYNMLNKPLPITQATLGTLLDCGKYNGIATALVKIAMAIILAITGGGGAAFSLIQDVVSGGMEIDSQIKDIKARS